MKESRVGCAPASHGVLRRGVEGGVKRRLPDRRLKDSWKETDMTMVRMPKGNVRRHPVRFWHCHLALDYDGSAIRRIRGSLAMTHVPSETRCRDAATGDAAAGIGIAFAMRDTARVVMTKMLGRPPDGVEAEIRVADFWLDGEVPHD
jgi:hypothetical protein